MVERRWPGCDLASVSMYVRAKQAAPFGHQQVLRPSVANECVRVFEQKVNGGSDVETRVWRWSTMPLHFRADRSSMHRAQRGRSECWVPEEREVDQIRGTIPV